MNFGSVKLNIGFNFQLGGRVSAGFLTTLANISEAKVEKIDFDYKVEASNLVIFFKCRSDGMYYEIITIDNIEETIVCKVTQENIDDSIHLIKSKGIKKLASCCPVALALADLGHFCEVHSDMIIIKNGDNFMPSIEPPKSVSQFVDKFDRDFTGEPFEFEITLPKLT